jgi:hypothetical protein
LSAERVSLWRRLLQGWVAVAGHFGEVQTLVLLTVVYLAVIGPVSLGAWIARRDLLDKRSLHEAGSAWREADTTPGDLERARHPF